MNKKIISLLGLAIVVLTIIDWVVYAGVQEVYAEDVYGFIINNTTLMAVVGGLIYLAKIIYNKLNAPEK